MAVVSKLKRVWWDPFVSKLEGWIRSFAVDLPDEPNWDQSNQGSWYIHPRRHGMEMFFLSSAFAVGTYCFYWRALGPGTMNYMMLRQFVADLPKSASPVLDKVVLSSLVASLGITLTHKVLHGNTLFMLQPCHMSALLLIFTMLYPKNKSVIPQILFNIYLHTQWGGLAALLFPDLSDHIYPLETFNFFAEHILILVAPICMIYSRRFLVLPPSINLALLSFSIYGFFHSPILHLCALKSGLNLNYLFTPPPVPFLRKLGPHYRLALYGTALAAMFTMRYCVVRAIVRK
ncbi:hypothetical protein DM01DRAFT_1310681 [Hesseltinella vesiculosa]|uniref:Transmembrane protein n=1 Tax=Hesseltinella vesiculosa TaxID=101127 RepID=A0A1X2G8H9_9FUNG|nr:hypothetical protein DM01DRAFT_1310681 [Hesseltinella vesiculosa]